jgi:hypothetical protein
MPKITTWGGASHPVHVAGGEPEVAPEPVPEPEPEPEVVADAPDDPEPAPPKKAAPSLSRTKDG